MISMKSKILFAFMIIVQLTVPLYMIYDVNQIRLKGKIHYFRCGPVDPTDAFRGQYVLLNYLDMTVPLHSGDSFQRNQKVYAILQRAKDGSSYISELSKNEHPNSEFIELKVQSVYDGKVYLEPPMDKYYMQEFKAPNAETYYQTASMDTNQRVRAKLYVFRGQHHLADLLVNDTSIHLLHAINQ